MKHTPFQLEQGCDRRPTLPEPGKLGKWEQKVAEPARLGSDHRQFIEIRQMYIEANMFEACPISGN